MIYTTDILGDQAVLLFHAFLLGLALGGCYDGFRLVKLFFSKAKAFRITLDVLFCAWAGFLLFSFFLEENYGIPRAYLYGGAAAGFLLWHQTAGAVIFYFEKKTVRILRAVGNFFLRPVRRLFEKWRPKGKNISEKARFYAEKLLKKTGRLVYNILCLSGKKVRSYCGRANGKERPDFENNGFQKEEKSSDSSGHTCLRHLSPIFSDCNAGYDHGEKIGTGDAEDPVP